MSTNSLNFFLLASCAALAACGGGGGSSSAGGTGPIGSVPVTPTPAPTPAPATTFGAVAAGPLAATVALDTNGNGQFGDAGDASTSTNLSGQFGRDVAVARPAQTVGSVPADPVVRLRAVGIDSWTGLTNFDMTAPVGATVVSPLSTLIDARGGSEAAVRAALGLTSGTEALRAETGLLTFNPALGLASADAGVANDAARLVSINLQLLALASLAKDTSGDPVDFSAPLTTSSTYLAEVIAATGNGRLSDAAVIFAVLKKTPYARGFPDAAVQAGAELIAKYYAAIPSRIRDERTARQWAYTFRFSVFPEFKRLLAQWPNPEAGRIGAITPASITATATFFADAANPFNASFVALPRFYELTGNEFTGSGATPYSLTLTGCTTLPYLPSCNSFVPFLSGTTATTVSTISRTPSGLEVTTDATGVTIRRVGTFSGLASFDYVARSGSGQEATGRAYVLVR